MHDSLFIVSRGFKGNCHRAFLKCRRSGDFTVAVFVYSHILKVMFILAMWNYLVPVSICDLICILKLPEVKKINKPGTNYSHKKIRRKVFLLLFFKRKSRCHLSTCTQRKEAHRIKLCESAYLSNHCNRFWAVGAKHRSITDEVLFKITTSENPRVRLENKCSWRET